MDTPAVTLHFSEQIGVSTAGRLFAALAGVRHAFSRQTGPSIHREAGFSLIETILAAGLLATLAVGVAQVFGVAARANHRARVQTLSAILAAQKLEQLRSLAWGHAPGGAPLSDTSTDLSSDPPSAGGTGLLRAPADALDADVPFYVDYLSAAGARVGSRDRAAFVRRWSVVPLAHDPDNLLLLQVRVLVTGGGDSRLVTMKVRRP